VPDNEPQEPLVGEVIDHNNAQPQSGGAPIQAFMRKQTAARLLVGINVAVYIAMVLNNVSPVNPLPSDLMHWGAMSGPEFVAGERWRLLTSGFIHVGLIHLTLNMWCLWYLAELAENIFGTWTTIGIYLICAMTGNLFVLLWHPHLRIPTAGASGAIFGIAGAIVTSLRVGKHRVPLPVRKAISNSAFRFAILNLVIGLLPGISNAAHLGGMVGGLLLGAGFGATDSMPIQKDLPLYRVLVALIVVLLVAAILFWFFPIRGPRWV
jgi:membrane associated rhomboid family serine protease